MARNPAPVGRTTPAPEPARGRLLRLCQTQGWPAVWFGRSRHVVAGNARCRHLIRSGYARWRLLLGRLRLLLATRGQRLQGIADPGPRIDLRAEAARF